MKNINKLLFIVNEKDLNIQIGDLNNFLNNEPQFHFNQIITKEVYLVLKDISSDDFFNEFKNIEVYLFNCINSYYQVIDMYKEFNDTKFENKAKISQYLKPLIVQMYEDIISNFLLVINQFKGTDNYAVTLGTLKNSTKNNFDTLFNNIDIDFRNAINHGNTKIFEDRIEYIFSQGKNKKEFQGKKTFRELINLKNNLLDDCSGVFLALLIYLNKIDFFNSVIYNKELSNNIIFELLKLHFKSLNINIEKFEIYTKEDELGNNIFEVFVNFSTLNDEKEIKEQALKIIEIIYKYQKGYDKYLLQYKHDYSVGSSFIFDKNGTLEINLAIPEIQETTKSSKIYKFNHFLNIENDNYKLQEFEDKSQEYKFLTAKLFIKNKNISKIFLLEIIGTAIEDINKIENFENPQDSVKYGIMESDIINLHVFYDNKDRENLVIKLVDAKIEINNNFICTIWYYKNQVIPKLPYPLANKLKFEDINKISIYWNSNIDITKR